MAPIQSRRSRKQRETVYINGQHTNLLKEISNPGPDGTVPLLNFLENTDQFIADTGQLQVKVAILEQELEKYKHMYDDFQKMATYMKQLSQFLSLKPLIHTQSLAQSDIDIETDDNNIIDHIPQSQQIQLPILPEFTVDKDDDLLMATINTSTNTVQTDYFKPNNAKKQASAFPNFNYTPDNSIKILMEPENVLQPDNNSSDITLLTNTNTRKLINASDIITNVVQDQVQSNNIGVDILLPSTHNRVGQDLYDIFPGQTQDDNKWNKSKKNRNPLMYSSDNRRSNYQIDLNELYHHNMVNQRLESDAEEIARTLLKNSNKKQKRKPELVDRIMTQKERVSKRNDENTSDNIQLFASTSSRNTKNKTGKQKLVTRLEPEQSLILHNDPIYFNSAPVQRRTTQKAHTLLVSDNNQNNDLVNYRNNPIITLKNAGRSHMRGLDINYSSNNLEEDGYEDNEYINRHEDTVNMIAQHKKRGLKLQNLSQNKGKKNDLANSDTHSIYSYTKTPNMVSLNNTHRSPRSLELYSNGSFTNTDMGKNMGQNIDNYNVQMSLDRPDPQLYAVEIEELNSIRDLLLYSDD